MSLSLAGDPDTRLNPGERPLAVWEPRVLVVDDDEICRFAAKHLLGKLGLAVDVAADGGEAVELSMSWPYAAIFMDCSMPELDGYQATRKVRTGRGLSRDALVVAVTVNSRHVSLASGMSHHIAKPLGRDVLESDCIRMGLLPRAYRQYGGWGDPVIVQAAPGTPLLAGLSSASDEPATRLAATLIPRALCRLPELWRATNAGDAATIRRVAGELQDRATSVGAMRVAELCGLLCRAAERGQMQAVADGEPRLRRALADTDAAIQAFLRPDGDAGRASAFSDGVLEPTPVTVAVAAGDPRVRGAVSTMIARRKRPHLGRALRGWCRARRALRSRTTDGCAGGVVRRGR